MKKLSDGELMRIIDEACKKFQGDATVLESAVGALVLGRKFGWQGIRVMHSRVTYEKYEEKLGIEFAKVLPERGPDSERLAGIRIADKLGQFWRAISGGVSAKEAAQIG